MIIIFSRKIIIVIWRMKDVYGYLLRLLILLAIVSGENGRVQATSRYHRRRRRHRVDVYPIAYNGSNCNSIRENVSLSRTRVITSNLATRRVYGGNTRRSGSRVWEREHCRASVVFSPFDRP